MKEQKGITLIALVITIIVMLILVAVSVSIVIQSGLFNSAKSAGQKTEAAYQNEGNNLSKADIGSDNDVDLGDLENYVDNKILGH